MSDRARACAAGTLLLTVALAACRPGEIPRGVPPARPAVAGTMPAVRVGIAVDTAEIRVGAGADFELRADGEIGTLDARAGVTWTFRPGAGGTIEASDGNRTLSSRAPILIRPAAAAPVTINGLAYRGDAVVRAGRDGVTAINLVDLEDYLLGVVPREIGPRPVADLEAVKAQAVAARTYAIGNLGGRESLGFDYFASVQDQVYGGVSGEDPVASRAIRETRGEIVTWDGVPILAYYSSTCGGRTAAIEASWPWRAPVPYLRSVSDRIPGTDRHYCDTSNRFRWSVTWTRAQLLETLGATLQAYTGRALAEPARIDDLTVRSNASDRATISFVADGEPYTVRNDSIRWVLRVPGGAGLNSSMIEQLDAITGPDASLAGLTVHGGGWGHGIGLCQVGALGRARSGQRYDEILLAYYVGTEIRRLY